MLEEPSTDANPYSPPHQVEKEPSESQPSQSELLISGSATPTEIARVLNKPIQGTIIIIGGSIVVSSILLAVLFSYPYTLGDLLVWSLGAGVAIGVTYAVFADSSGSIRAKRILKRAPWLCDPVRGSCKGNAMHIEYPTIGLWTTLVSGRSEIWTCGYSDNIWGNPIVLTDNQFEAPLWWQRVTYSRRSQLRVDAPTIPDGAFNVTACRLGSWTQSILSGNSRHWTTIAKMVSGGIALGIGGWMLYFAWDLYRSITWTPYWTNYYNRVAPWYWIFGCLLTFAGIILAGPPIMGMWLNRAAAKFRGGIVDQASMIMTDAFLFLRHDNAAIRCQWSHIKDVNINRHGLGFRFQNNHRFLVPRIAFANESEFQTACVRAKASVKSA
ncbi:hypothetical protein CA13_35150 [Planctomycetes bacterium CA13]|uniref:Uncharacterized protein n=1 Tax=Novipirellula herctigrandis TaxID=2527986 RepID=A0A5C5Z4F0_9BACT|nr:hypothetical protein CA13_35150 [Planctomycetes bacterium CA13]